MTSKDRAERIAELRKEIIELLDADGCAFNSFLRGTHVCLAFDKETEHNIPTMTFMRPDILETVYPELDTDKIDIVPYAEWKVAHWNNHVCSNCGGLALMSNEDSNDVDDEIGFYNSDYCPHCGARMA